MPCNTPLVFDQLATADTALVFGSVGRAITPGGLDPLQFGAPSVKSSAISCFASGADELLMGEPQVRNQLQICAVAGFELLQFGTPGVRPKGATDLVFGELTPADTHLVFSEFLGQSSKRTITPAGHSSEQFGATSCRLAFSICTAEGFDTSQVGTSRVHPPHSSCPVEGFDTLDVGTPKISAPYLTCNIEGFASEEFGTPSLRTSFQRITVAGIPAPVDAPTELWVSLRSPHPVGLVATAFGTADVHLYTRYITPPALLATTFGAHNIAWYRQFIYPTPAADAIELPRPKIAYKSQYISPESFGTVLFGVQMVGTRRWITPDGLDDEGIGWAALHSTEQSFKPEAIDNTIVVGTPLVYNLLQYLPVQGFSTTQYELYRWGEPVVFNSRQYVEQYHDESSECVGEIISRWSDISNRMVGAYGSIATRWGYPEVVNSARVLDTAGADHAVFGTAFLESWVQYVSPGGVGSAVVFGDHIIGLAEQRIVVTAGDAALFGTGFVSLERRYVAAIQIPPPISNPEPWVSASPRYLAPSWPDNLIPKGPVIGFTRSAATVGTDTSLFGQANVHDNSQWLYTVGGNPEGMPEPVVSNWIRYLHPASVRTYTDESLRWGLSWVRNLNQFVTLGFDIDNLYNGHVFGQWTSIENRNLVVATFGDIATRMGFPLIVNHARLIAPEGMGAPAESIYYQAGSVTHFERSVWPVGIADDAPSRWSVVYNGARPVAIEGDNHVLWGMGSVREHGIIGAGGINTFAQGTPFVAPRIRSVAQIFPVANEYVPMPRVLLWQRHIEPLGIPPREVGKADLSIHFNNAAAFGTRFDVFGIHELRNNTPEVLTQGYAHEEFGDSAVRTQWREVRALGDTATLFGPVRIADRRLWVENVTILTPPFGNATVTKIGADLPSQQTITCPSFPSEAEYRPDLWWGMPVLNQQSVYPVGISSFIMGVPRADANSIRMMGIPYPFPCPDPIVALRNRVVTARGIEQTEIKWGWPRVTPHTVYAVMECTDQAAENHQTKDKHFVGQNPSTGELMYGVGAPTVTLQHRTIHPNGLDLSNPPSATFPQPEVSLWLRIIEVPSFRPLRVGSQTFSGGDLAPIVVEGIDATAVFGETTSVARGPVTGTQTVLFDNYMALEFGVHGVQNKNRVLAPTGIYSERLGTSAGSGSRYMPQALTVGFPDNPPMQGFDSAVMSDGAWASLKVRELVAESFDAFICDYDVDYFNERLRVRNAFIYSLPVQTASALGEDATEWGWPATRNHTQRITPDGNAETFRQGAY